MRGKDIDYNPVFFARAILYIDVDKEFLHLFADQEKFSEKEIKEHLTNSEISLFDPDEIFNRITCSNEFCDYKIVVDSDSINQRMFQLLKENRKENSYKFIDQNVVEHTKGVKTQREIKGLRECNIRDGAALVKYFAWLENELVNKNRKDLTEYEAGQMSAKFRGEQRLFMGESFYAISASGPNAAVIHYKPSEKSSGIVKKENIYLLDSGGQYLYEYELI